MSETILNKWIRIIIRRRKFIAVFTIISIILSILISKYVITPVYKSSTSLIINRVEGTPAAEPNYDELLFYNTLIPTYSDLLKSKTILEVAITNSGYDIDYPTLLSRLSIKSTSGSDIIQISVKGRNQEETRVLANEIANSFISQVPQLLLWKNDVRVLDKANFPYNTIYPRVYTIALITGLIALLGSILFLLIFECFDRTRRTSATKS